MERVKATATHNTKGRPKIQPTHKIIWVEVKSKSNAGVEYTHYKPTKVTA